MMCTSGFVDDVVFSYNGSCGGGGVTLRQQPHYGLTLGTVRVELRDKHLPAFLETLSSMKTRFSRRRRLVSLLLSL